MSRPIAILGAGISGLSIAWHLKQAEPSRKLHIIEKSHRVGGWIQTIQKEGFLFELGPKSCRMRGQCAQTLALIESLGIQDQMLYPHPDAKSRYVHDGDHLRSLPRRLWQLGVFSALYQDWKSPKGNGVDESIYSFFNRRIGKKWADNLIDPLVSGIYAGDCRKLSIKACFPLIDQWEKQSGSLLKGALHNLRHKTQKSPALFSFKNGMETLPLALGERLKNELLLNQSVTGLKWHNDHIQIHLEGGQFIEVEQVISTLPTYALAPLLDLQQLVALKYASVCVVNLGYHHLITSKKGFGYLIPSGLHTPVLGCVFDSSVFPEQDAENQKRMTVMLGGMHYPEIINKNDDELVALSLKTLKKDLNINKEPTIIHVHKASKAIPQFEMGYLSWKKEIEKEIKEQFPGLILAGSGWAGVSINDCINHTYLAKK